ncbi:hypothetical protein Hanom_Chr12g01150861 [Helianthus anomalus]
MGVGTQTQQLIEYCNTSLQLTGVSYDVAARDASNKNKKVLLKKADSNIKRYNKLVTEMNEMVKEAKAKCYWDLEIMKMCKKWDEIVKNTVSMAEHGTFGDDEAYVAKDIEVADNIEEFSRTNDVVKVEIAQMTSQDEAIFDSSEAHLCNSLNKEAFQVK